MSDCQRISILGATGSIGQNSLDIVRQHPSKFTVRALTANHNIAQLVKDAEEFKPEYIAVGDSGKYLEIKEAVSHLPVKVGAGEEALVEAASIETDIVMSSIVGTAGLKPTIAAIHQGAVIALANKECLVCAGDYFIKEAKAYNSKILPVDSEHNAIYQVFDFEQSEKVSKITLTASGGPFRERSADSFQDISVEEALAHPNWTMGAKISIDSATLMNKGLELIEAFYLFPVEVSQLDAVIHPQSIIHSLVEYYDGSVLAQLGAPDMRVPISYCMGLEQRLKTNSPRLDLAAIANLSFSAPDEAKFPCLGLAKSAMNTGGAMPLVLNAANEVAVAAFLQRTIGFMDIPKYVEKMMEKFHDMKAPHSLSNVLELDREVREYCASDIMRFG